MINDTGNDDNEDESLGPRSSSFMKLFQEERSKEDGIAIFYHTHSRVKLRRRYRSTLHMLTNILCYMYGRCTPERVPTHRRHSKSSRSTPMDDTRDRAIVASLRDTGSYHL
ncbi:hypothetical protein V6N11_072979 [Hibiscus sabdariffa]|uniref:Uncharacterized protein n=1 Tax=Hibiscus sabdariffa TaxID=183260 RepID=A0ABR2NWU2_9ROSI